MIARKITYTGPLDVVAAEVIYDIVREVEITGEVKFFSPGKIELHLEGDPAMIKLVQHQVEHRIQGLEKEVIPRPFHNYQGLDFSR